MRVEAPVSDVALLVIVAAILFVLCERVDASRDD